MLFPILLGVSIVIFVLIQMAPGDPAQMLLGSYASPERVAELREEMGLNDSILVQYFRWLFGVLRGDFGISYMTRNPVIEEIFSRLPATLELTLFSFFYATIVGIVLGVLSAVHRGSVIDIASTIGSILGMSIPAFWLGLLLMYTFSISFGILPLGGRIDLTIKLEPVTHFYVLDSLITGNLPALKSSLSHLILPAVVLAIYPIAEIAQLVRTNMLDVLGQDYIRTARAKGASQQRVIYKHALKNVMIPVVTIAGLRLGAQFAGAILVEIVFSWPGIGRLAFDAIHARDYPLIEGDVLFVTIVFVLVNLLVDILYVYIDPRVERV